MTGRKAILGLALTDGYGALAGAWRAPHVDADNYARIEANIRYAQAAERGGFTFLFTPDFPAVRGDVERSTISNIMDPMMQLAAISQATSRIGFVATGSTTFQEPFNTARQFKALDVMSHGRAGWNAVTTSDPAVSANYGKPVAERAVRYQRAHESIQVVQALWGSWQEDAWIKDQTSGRFIDASKLRPVNLQGEYVASRGPLAIPPSEQGQPVIFTSGGPSPHLLQLAGRYASGFIAEVWTIEEARAQRQMVRDAAREAGRDPDDIKYFAGLMTTVAPTVREGLDRRLALAGDVIEARLPHLGALLGLHIEPSRYDEPLTPAQLAAAHASPLDPRSSIALDVAREGWSPRDILAHGVIDYHPTTVGPAEVHADHLQKWFEAGAADGFWISPDIYEDGVDAFVDQVVPLLRARGIYPEHYAGATLRENLGVPRQYGPDPRIKKQ
ncbi:NtaA/DmoA family FMN-dependent monooxygenase [Streptomyces griseoloalbus]|uniref:FMN-dependent oxidoreductase (Nitrilotriacetate monooxygenase family) n=1 Tax=Streptomyces griseoloalbus TaxID=67303 RepID=A0A7W8F9C1_9ACTN|nr:NtaA/DmoA family FMN-dependent monooxygenase [Streptomyces albaduncus]MBB5125251.1 FMN-dependent oxidoreductase (nitrilotriacetate monooxygenase family) [Streptomyces albaduncus]GGW28990.1 nitrilotriacetate monooxygenase [Streptomyces albaduncus]